MKISLLYLPFLFLCSLKSLGQGHQKIDILLNQISEVKNSKEITLHPASKEIMQFDIDSLPSLAFFFPDSTKTEIYSECQNRKLVKGEIAIILADQIEGMPYFYLTNVTNSSLEFCADNPNNIEFYFQAITIIKRKIFQEIYYDWLVSEYRR